MGACPSSGSKSIWQDDITAYGAVGKNFQCVTVPVESYLNFSELFAEQFYMGASGGKWQTPTSYTSYAPPPFWYTPPGSTFDIDILGITNSTNGLACSNYWLWTYMNTGARPTWAEIQNAVGKTRCGGTLPSVICNAGKGG